MQQQTLFILKNQRQKPLDILLIIDQHNLFQNSSPCEYTEKSHRHSL